ncbi:MAG TPA: IPExxxVDY family protein [Bacteroidales bacterium]|nr:IPExxxVDY family protein [Bacteroidales bacterium]
MKEKEKITRHTIFSAEPAEFLFLGIVTSEPDYRLSVMLNRQLGISLQHSSNDIIAGSGDDAPHFSVFTTSPAILSLISNRTPGNFLIRKLKTIDFFLVIHGVPDRAKADNLSALIRKNPDITAVFVFNSTLINDRNTKLLVQ